MLVQVWKVAPALAAGNSVILKPSEYASVTSLELGAIAGEHHGRAAVWVLDCIQPELALRAPFGHFERCAGNATQRRSGCRRAC